MPLTIPPIPNAAPFAAFSDNVGIFSNSKAREIPTRLNAIAQALKDHINTLWLATATSFINGTVIAGLNAARLPFIRIDLIEQSVLHSLLVPGRKDHGVEDLTERCEMTAFVDLFFNGGENDLADDLLG